jgi:hypothetical protein
MNKVDTGDSGNIPLSPQSTMVRPVEVCPENKIQDINIARSIARQGPGLPGLART